MSRRRFYVWGEPKPVPKRLDLWAYCVLTQLIIILGNARGRLFHRLSPTVFPDHTVFGEYQNSNGATVVPYQCCDCGAAHLYYPGKIKNTPGIFATAVRPCYYRYNLRAWNKPASLVKEGE